MRKKNKALKKLIKDLDRFTRDWEKLLSNNDLAKNSDFLKQLAADIQHLNDDTIGPDLPYCASTTAHLIRHILSTPIGAPIVTEKTLLDAALSLKYQDPIRSDLSEITLEFTKHSPPEENDLLSIFHSFHERLKKER